MKKILIIGGGISGLSAAVLLANEGFEIELIEASPKYGGKTYSFDYNNTVVDNGQHILMECYSNTLEYVDLIGAREKLEFQETLSTVYIDQSQKYFRLKIPKYFHPFNKILGLLSFDLLNLKDRFSILKLLIKISLINTDNFTDQTVSKFLEQSGQSKDVISKFWESFVVSTMNTSISDASAKVFIDMAKIVFGGEKKNTNIIIPKVDLSSALINPAIDKLEHGGAKLTTSEKVISIRYDGDQAVEVQTNKRTISDFDILISSVPIYSLSKIKLFNSSHSIALPNLNYSPIVTVHVWLKNNPLKEKMYNLVGGEFDWVFNHGTYISLVKSSAQKLVTINKNTVIKIVFSELKKYFTILTNIVITDYIMLKEINATFIPDMDSVESRKLIKNSAKNFFIIGDWTNTGLPATIESAVKSSKDVTTRIVYERFN